MTQLRKSGLTPARMSQAVTYAKKQDQVPKLLLTIQFVGSPKDLKRSRRGTRFTENVKTYVKRILVEGEERGKKASAADACSNIRAQRDGSGTKIFAKGEWLLADQIARYFSRLSVLYKSDRLPLKQVNADTTEDEEGGCVTKAEDMTTMLEFTWKCDHTIYPSYTDAAHS